MSSITVSRKQMGLHSNMCMFQAARDNQVLKWSSTLTLYQVQTFSDVHPVAMVLMITRVID